jgi:hypothetical protein
MRNVYGFQSLLNNGFDGTGTTIAIIDAYGSDTIQGDLGAFDAYMGLPAANLNISCGRPASGNGPCQSGRLEGRDDPRRRNGSCDCAVRDDRPRRGQIEQRRRHPQRD